MDERKFWVWMSMCLGQGSMLAGKILDCFGTPKDAVDSGYDEIARCIGTDKQEAVKMFTRYTLGDAENIVTWCDIHHVRILTVHDEDYPIAIRHQLNLPLVLYCYGHIPPWSTDFSCAVVGTRKMTDYGKRSAYDLGYDLATGGAMVVSGLAIGVDGMAMAGALSAGGITVAVLGCGIDICYPKVHRTLLKEVVRRGIAITEYPPATPPSGPHFPVRNRIISGISQATVVVEGDDNSGALITANHAIWQGKAVFAVPGNIDSESSNGPNTLIKQGVPAVTEAADVLIEFKDVFPSCINPSRLRRRYLSKKDDEYLDAAALYHVVSSLDDYNGYYGHGAYGGRDIGRIKRERRTKGRTAPKNESPQAATDVSPERSADRPGAERKSAERAEPLAVQPEANSGVPIDTEFMNGLDEKYIAIYNSMKPDVPTLPDEICTNGYDISDVLAAMTMLEISGAVEGSPGGYFTRKGNEEYTVPSKDE